MAVMRIGPDGRNIMCRNCLDRKPVQKQQLTVETKVHKQEPAMKEYFCKECKYSFTRAKHLTISACPYCGSSGSLMIKGSASRILADASKMKGDFDFR